MSIMQILFILIISLLLLAQGIFAQADDENKTTNMPQARLITTSPYSNSEVESFNIDILGNEIRKNPNSKGVFVIYCGKLCQYGEVEAHLRGLNISLRGKGWKNTQFILLQGGFKEQLMIEYWLVPENACLPILNSSVDIKDVKFKGTYKRNFVAYDCC